MNQFSLAGSGCTLNLGILGHQTLDEGNVLLLGGLGGFALLLVPCLPLGLALQIQQAGFAGLIVANGGLLEESVQLKELIIAGTLGQRLHLLGGGVELLKRLND